MTNKPTVLVSLATLGLGCTVQSWRPSELQLDVQGTGLTDTDRIRICVDGYGMREAALGAGSIAFTGLPPDTDLTITVDALVQVDDQEDSASSQDLRSGRAGPICLGAETQWGTADWSHCSPTQETDTGIAGSDGCEPCQSPGERVRNGETSIVLAIRFLD